MSYPARVEGLVNMDIYIYIVSIKPELGVIPSGQENHSGAEHLNFPGEELNVIFYRIWKIK